MDSCILGRLLGSNRPPSPVWGHGNSGCEVRYIIIVRTAEDVRMLRVWLPVTFAYVFEGCKGEGFEIWVTPTRLFRVSSGYP